MFRNFGGALPGAWARGTPFKPAPGSSGAGRRDRGGSRAPGCRSGGRRVMAKIIALCMAIGNDGFVPGGFGRESL